MIRFDGFYRSSVQAHIRYENGVRKEEEYYLFYKFFPDGIWVCKTIGAPRFRMEQFLETIDMTRIRREPHHDEPMLANKELFYQCGTYSAGMGKVMIEWQNTNVQKEPMFWNFNILDAETLETEMGEYQLEFMQE